MQEGNLLYNIHLDIGIADQDDSISHLETVQIMTQDHTFTFDVESDPRDVTLDLNTWLLMQVDFKRR